MYTAHGPIIKFADIHSLSVEISAVLVHWTAVQTFLSGSGGHYLCSGACITIKKPAQKDSRTAFAAVISDFFDNIKADN